MTCFSQNRGAHTFPQCWRGHTLTVHQPLPAAEDVLVQPQFIVMETSRVFVSKPSLKAWIKTAFPLGNAGQGQLLCPYFLILYPYLIFWAYLRAPQATLSSPACTPPVQGTSSWCSVSLPKPIPPHHQQPGAKHIFTNPSVSLPSCRSQAARRSPVTISHKESKAEDLQQGEMTVIINILRLSLSQLPSLRKNQAQAGSRTLLWGRQVWRGWRDTGTSLRCQECVTGTARRE